MLKLRTFILHLRIRFLFFEFLFFVKNIFSWLPCKNFFVCEREMISLSLTVCTTP